MKSAYHVVDAAVLLYSMFMKMICIGCNREPREISSIVMFAEEEGLTPDEFVRENEGTYNEVNGHFLCDADYIKQGMPSSSTGWIAP